MPSSPFFLDTKGWIELLNERKALHERVKTRWLELSSENRPVVLTDWIIAETGNGLARTRARQDFVSSVNAMLRSPRVTVVPIDRSLLTRALKRYDEGADKSWGLVDCASFIVMEDKGITDAFTTDEHFDQAGFRGLLPD